MARVGFIGLGNMGSPMAINLVKAGHVIKVFDLQKAQVDELVSAGAKAATSALDAASDVDCVITMLPEGKHVRSVYLGAKTDGSDGILASADRDVLLIDCSTIDVESVREVSSDATNKGFEFIDAPVSGGVAGAAAAKLTFMVGGSQVGFDRALPLLEAMGKSIVHAGASGSGQAAKLCNNMLLGIHMIAVAEAFELGRRLGLEDQKLFDVCNQSSGQCWTLTNYCPVPGPVPTSPANRDYAPGFAASLMAKDLRLAQQAAQTVSAATPLGAHANALYTMFSRGKYRDLDCSAIIKMIRESDSRPTS